MPCKHTYTALWAALRKRVESKDSLFVLDAEKSNDECLCCYPKDKGSSKDQFCVTIVDGKLYVKVFIKGEYTDKLVSDLNGCDDETVSKQPKDYLTKIVDSAWFQVVYLVISSKSNLDSAIINDYKTRPFCMTGINFFACAEVNHSFSKAIYEPPKSLQDINHNQEALFSLVNESLENPMQIFKDQELNERNKKLAKSELAKFRLYGMMLWDRDRDADIDRVILKRYSSLQESAGEFFKLMPLFSGSTHVYRDYAFDDSWADFYKDVSKKIADDCDYANAFLRALNISEQGFPYLIVTAALTAKQFLLIPLIGIDINGLVECLGEISEGEHIPLETYQEAIRHTFGTFSEIRKLRGRTLSQRLIGPLAKIMLNPATGISIQMESAENLLRLSREAAHSEPLKKSMH